MTFDLIDHCNVSELSMAEMRLSLEADKQRAVQEMMKHMEIEKTKEVEETKKKQWVSYNNG